MAHQNFILNNTTANTTTMLTNYSGGANADSSTTNRPRIVGSSSGVISVASRCRTINVSLRPTTS